MEVNIKAQEPIQFLTKIRNYTSEEKITCFNNSDI